MSNRAVITFFFFMLTNKQRPSALECDVPRTVRGLCNVRWPGLEGVGVSPGEQKKECGGSACLSPREAPRRGWLPFRLKRRQPVLSAQAEVAAAPSEVLTACKRREILKWKCTQLCHFPLLLLARGLIGA